MAGLVDDVLVMLTRVFSDPGLAALDVYTLKQRTDPAR